MEPRRCPACFALADEPCRLIDCVYPVTKAHQIAACGGAPAEDPRDEDDPRNLFMVILWIILMIAVIGVLLGVARRCSVGTIFFALCGGA